MILFTTLSCSKKLIPTINPNSIISEINKSIKSGKLGETPLLVLDGDFIDLKKLKLIDEFDLKDFEKISVLSKKEAKKKYGDNGKNGAVVITPFKDDLLDQKYYQGITNGIVTKNISDNVEKGLIRENPILVLDGVPLRGNDIVEKINALKSSDIKSIDYLKEEAACRVFGVRALPGVLLITTK